MLAVKRSFLTLVDINPLAIQAGYAVRGAVLARAQEIQSRLDLGEKLPFRRLYLLNTGNPQSLGQSPLSYIRQTLSLVTNPTLLNNTDITRIFP
jgi:alanine transaminase